jgi:flagellar basal-body rod modification protein FlgD
MMASISNVSASAAAAAASTTAGTGASSGASGLTQSDFLQLLTAQLKYHSPTSPADTTQMAQEFASISTVDGINTLNSQLSSIATTASAAEMAQASALVGKQVAVSGNTLTPTASGKAEGAFSLASPSASTNVTVLNPNGSIADMLRLGPLAAGQQSFTWSGGTSGTNYSYQINAVDASNNQIAITPYTVFSVGGVNLTGATPTLNINGSSTPLPVSSVQTVLGASS